mmetsp:Transcript_1050/g.2233  ORF Transcript_1050/g.2233 Transcript_1050/m.2233 type:complete len:101 (+) Transcript_1050:118-420(+)
MVKRGYDWVGKKSTDNFQCTSEKEQIINSVAHINLHWRVRRQDGSGKWEEKEHTKTREKYEWKSPSSKHETRDSEKGTNERKNNVTLAALERRAPRKVQG